MSLVPAPRSRLVSRVLLTAVAIAAIGLSGSAHAATPAFLPPDAKTAKACVASVPVDLGIDWTAWDGQATDRSREDLVAIAAEYAVGSARVAKNAETARRILAHLSASKEGAPPEAAEIEARLLIATGDAADREKAADLLTGGMRAGSRTASRMLGDLLADKDAKGALRAYRVAAAQGDPRASLALARMLKRTPKTDPAVLDLAVTNAFAAIVAAVEAGDCRASRLMSALYSDGAFGPARPDLAMAWTRYAADKGDSSAAMALAKAYHRGVGVTPDETQAVRYFEIAANAGRASALLPVGIAYATGLGVAQDLSKAAQFLQKAGEVGRTDAWYWLARLHRGEFGGTPDPAKSFANLVLASKVPGAPAEVFLDLGRAQRDGFGTTIDPVGALKSLEDAANAGSDKGAFEAAELVQAGAPGVEKDLKRAVRLFRLAASNGSAAAALRLGEVYRCGKGADFSPDKAFAWVERAAFLGSSSSMEIYARRLLSDGDAAVRDRGFLLLRKAAQGGDSDAAASLMLAYETGEGVAADPAMAERWRAHGKAVAAVPGAFEIALAKARLSASGAEALPEARALFEAAAAAGHPGAAFELARALDEIGGADPADLIEILLPSAKAGFVPAMRKVGELLTGTDTAGDRTGQEWLAAAAKQGDFTATLALAKGLPDEARAAELDRIAADGGACIAEDFAKLGIAWLSLGDKGHARAAEWGARAAETVEPSDGGTLLAIADLKLATGGDRTEAETYVRRALEADEPKALRRLAEGLATGAFGRTDAEAARTLVASRGDAGDRRADVLLLRMAADDLIVPSAADLAKVMDRIGGSLESAGGDLVKLAAKARAGAFGEDGKARANVWLEKAAEAGKPAAMRAMAEIYLYGPDEGRDPKKGMAWLQKAADAGDRDAMRALSAAYEVGFVVPADASRADALRTSASETETTATP